VIESPISHGELIDKITILKLKLEHIHDKDKTVNVNKELNMLLSKYENIPKSNRLSELTESLYEINKKIWKIEDDIRDHERRKNFGSQFIQLARGVYINNDERARIKKEINNLCKSDIIEEKSYTEY